DRPLSRGAREKIALFCNVHANDVFEVRDVESVYELPLLLEKEGIGKNLQSRLALRPATPDFSEWEASVKCIKTPKHSVRVAICGKYIQVRDSYKSITEAFVHAGAELDARVELHWIEAEDFEKHSPAELLSGAAGLLVPGGFGERGIEGKIAAVRYAREKGLPFLGLCLGLQTAVIEFARDVCGLRAAHSREFAPNTRQPVIDFMPEQRDLRHKGATMRLGSYPCFLSRGSLAHKTYSKDAVTERHRHRFEVNNEYRALLEEHGMTMSGIWPEGDLVEIIELPSHPWFVAVQFHPEFKSRLTHAHPLFRQFVAACMKRGREGRREAKATKILT
ncbi:MAG: CTP synthase, partial [Calditrichaeota bacterium]|nr:CTP synthase [Calditrichota bacterium]